MSGDEVTDVRTRAILVAAALVALFLLVQVIVGTITGLFYMSPQAGYLGAQIGSISHEFATRILPIAIGVFFVFWRFRAPITAGLPLRRVLLRSLVAAAAGSVLALAVGLIAGFSTGFSGSIFGNSFPIGDFAEAFVQFANLVLSAITGYVSLVPLVALAAVLLWLWLREHRS